MSERRGNPFGWILLGFIVGVLATFGTILFFTADNDGGAAYEDGPAEVRTAAEQAAEEALAGAPARSAQRRVETVTPAETPAPAVRADRPAAQPQELDPQVADDAAAAGMTSRTR